MWDTTAEEFWWHFSPTSRELARSSSRDCFSGSNAGSERHASISRSVRHSMPSERSTPRGSKPTRSYSLRMSLEEK